jgi:RHS repeat-associated protein
VVCRKANPGFGNDERGGFGPAWDKPGNGARFRPYGDEITSTSNDGEKFATYTRDWYRGFDYADQRFYASTYGRLNTPDPYAGSIKVAAPISWNPYSYVLGDPIGLNDPTG